MYSRTHLIILTHVLLRRSKPDNAFYGIIKLQVYLIDIYGEAGIAWCWFFPRKFLKISLFTGYVSRFMLCLLPLFVA